MIFVTVGTELPFDRLIKAIDTWVEDQELNHDFFAQIGEGAWTPKHMDSAPFLKPQQMAEKFAKAELIISHAGMGTILKAIEMGKNLVIIPRKASLGEQRNEHQLATAKQMESMELVKVAYDTDELKALLMNQRFEDFPEVKLSPFASQGLITEIKKFIQSC